MQTAILIVWWIGLIGALIVTLAVLKEVFLIIGTLRDILRLAELTRTAARGLAHNVEAVAQLGEAAFPAQHLHEASSRLAASATAVARQMDAIIEAEEG